MKTYRMLFLGLAIGIVAMPRAVHADSPGAQATLETELAHRVDRDRLVRVAVARNPGLRASGQRARALATRASAESRLPDPEAMVEVTQVPIERPSPVNGMIMVGLLQRFPAPGSLSARERTGRTEALEQHAMTQVRARELIRDVDHAFVDYQEATERHARHREHRALVERVVRAAEARQSAGGRLSDVTQAQLEAAKLDADLATDAAAVKRARARLNGLLARRLDAPLAEPTFSEATSIRESPTELLALARKNNPELRVADARVETRRAALRAVEREATWPSFSLGVLYYPPTRLMDREHGYGVTASASLPWLWGSSERRRRAEAELARASGSDADDARYRLGVEVGSTEASVRAAEARLGALKDSALPAAKRTLDLAFSGYAAGSDDLFGVLRAEEAVVDTEIAIVAARAGLDHALVDLDWAVGTRVPRVPLVARKPTSKGGGHDVRP